MYLREHLEKLHYFYEIAQLGSMKKASQAVFVTQPSLSKSMKILEEVVGHELFIRLPRGVKMTEAGEVLYQYCHELFSSLKSVEKRLESLEDPMAGSLRVGTYDSIGIYFWPAFLKKFLAKFPNLSIEMTTGRSRQMQDLLNKGELDLILVINPDESAQSIIQVLREDRFKFYRSTKKKLLFENLEEAPFIVMPDSFAPGESVRDKLNPFKIDERKIYSMSSLESVKELTLNGLGLGFLPEGVAGAAVEKGQLEAVDLGHKSKSGLFPHKVSLSYHKARDGHPLLETLIQEIKASL